MSKQMLTEALFAIDKSWKQQMPHAQVIWKQVVVFLYSGTPMSNNSNESLTCNMNESLQYLLSERGQSSHFTIPFTFNNRECKL